VSPAPAGSLEWYLAQAGAGTLFLDLRAAHGDPLLVGWLRALRTTYDMSWAYQDPAQRSRAVPLREWYDGLLFVSESTPTRPTANARNTVAQKASF
jgi:erythromycin esterase-like protein